MTTSRCEGTIRIAAAVVVDAHGHILLVRKRGTHAFMQPGGKLDRAESAGDAPARELREELGCEVKGERHPLGVFRAPAANEPGLTVEAELFEVDLCGEVAVSAEIEEAIWLDPWAERAPPLAPLTRDHVLPLVRARNAV